MNYHRLRPQEHQDEIHLKPAELMSYLLPFRQFATWKPDFSALEQLDQNFAWLDSEQFRRQCSHQGQLLGQCLPQLHQLLILTLQSAPGTP